MKKTSFRILALTLILALGVSFCLAAPSFAEEEKTESVAGTNISLSPVSKVLSLASSSKYDDSFEIKNQGDNNMDVEVHASPYSYVYSSDDDAYKLGFNTENNYTQIARWISFRDANGKWSDNPIFSIPAKSSLNVEYRITTPDNIPAGGQYAVIFAHTLTGVVAENGIKTEASPGLVVYGRSTEGEATIVPEISDIKFERRTDEKTGKTNDFRAMAKVKNNGNVDFNASGKLKVDAIIGSGGYETETGRASISIIPETELIVSDEWEDAPSFGIYRASWTVTAGDKTETIEKIIFVNPLPIIIIAIILLTILIVVLIIVIRKRKERRSRLVV